jgi:hypothetical protein
MAFVPVPRDLSKIKTKLLLNLTSRQLVCFGSAAAVGLPTYFMARDALGNSTAVLVMIGVMLPAFFIAMYERDGQPAEKILRNILRSRWFYPAKRPYKTENFYSLLEQIKTKEAKFGGIQNPKAGKTRTAAIRKRPAGSVKQK